MYPVRGEMVSGPAAPTPYDCDRLASDLVDEGRRTHDVVVERVRCHTADAGLRLIAFVSAASAEAAVSGLRERLLELTRPPAGPLRGWLLIRCSLGFDIGSRLNGVNPEGAVNR
jgi:hypothetical protein